MYVPYARTGSFAHPSNPFMKRKRKGTQILILKLRQEAAVTYALTGEMPDIKRITDPRIMHIHEEYRFMRMRGYMSEFSLLRRKAEIGQLVTIAAMRCKQLNKQEREST